MKTRKVKFCSKLAVNFCIGWNFSKIVQPNSSEGESGKDMIAADINKMISIIVGQFEEGKVIQSVGVRWEMTWYMKLKGKLDRP